MKFPGWFSEFYIIYEVDNITYPKKSFLTGVLSRLDIVFVIMIKPLSESILTRNLTGLNIEIYNISMFIFRESSGILSGLKLVSN